MLEKHSIKALLCLFILQATFAEEIFFKDYLKSSSRLMKVLNPELKSVHLPPGNSKLLEQKNSGNENSWETSTKVDARN